MNDVQSRTLVRCFLVFNSTKIHLLNCSLVHSSNCTWLLQFMSTKKNLHSLKQLDLDSHIWLNRSENSHTLSLQGSHIEPERRLNIQAYKSHTHGIMTDTHALIKDDLQSWGAVKDYGGQQHITPVILQYHKFLAFLGPFVTYVVKDTQRNL